jgi:hypothetical protein
MSLRFLGIRFLALILVFSHAAYAQQIEAPIQNTNPGVAVPEAGYQTQGGQQTAPGEPTAGFMGENALQLPSELPSSIVKDEPEGCNEEGTRCVDYSGDIKTVTTVSESKTWEPAHLRERRATLIKHQTSLTETTHWWSPDDKIWIFQTKRETTTEKETYKAHFDGIGYVTDGTIQRNTYKLYGADTSKPAIHRVTSIIKTTIIDAVTGDVDEINDLRTVRNEIAKTESTTGFTRVNVYAAKGILRATILTTFKKDGTVEKFKEIDRDGDGILDWYQRLINSEIVAEGPLGPDFPGFQIPQQNWRFPNDKR